MPEHMYTLGNGSVIRVVTSGPFSLVVNNKPVVTFKTDGSVEFGEGVAPDEAAREFWTLLASANPLRGEVERLKTENAAMLDLTRRVVEANTMSEWGIAGLADTARAILAENDEHTS